MNINDRRECVRAKISQAVDLDIVGASVGVQTLSAEMDTLSPRGVSISTPAKLSEGFRMKIRIPLPEGQQVIEAPVQMVWGKVASGNSLNKYGLVFQKLRGLDYKAISTLVEDFLKKSSVDGNRRQDQRRRDAVERSSSSKRSQNRRMDFPTYPLFINGRDVDTGAYEYFAYADKWIVDPKATASIISEAKKGNILPETNDYIFARSCVGNEEHNNLAIESASRAFQVFGSFPLSKRIKILGDIHELLLEHKAEILRLFIAEGHPGRLGEWEFSGMLQAYEKKTVALYRSEFAKALEGRNSEKGLLIRKPDGVICFSPPRNAAASNSLTGGLTFLGGNTIVLKPPLTLPISTIFLWRNVVNEALRRNGAPSGTLNIVVGNTVKFINQWIKHPLVNDIIYFGDSKRGQELGVKIFSAGKKPILELSGKDIVVVWRDANIDAAAESLIDCFLGSTQICMVPKMALVHESIYDRFEKAFVNKVKQLKVGLPTDPNTYLSPVCQMDSYFAFLNDAIEKGAKKLCGGRRLDHRGDPSDDGPYIEPTVLRFDADEPKINLRCVNEENFFPLLPLLKVTSKSTRSRPRGLEDADEIIFRKMMEILDSNQYGLRVSAWSNSDSMIRRFVREIDGCGLLRINCRHVDFSMFMATHGGPRKTGGPYGELNYFWQKTTHLQGVTYKT